MILGIRVDYLEQLFAFFWAASVYADPPAIDNMLMVRAIVIPRLIRDFTSNALVTGKSTYLKTFNLFLFGRVSHYMYKNETMILLVQLFEFK